MNRNEYNALRRKLEEARDDAVANAEAEFEQAAEALDRLWEVAGDGEPARRGPGRPRKKKTRRKATRKKRTTRGRKKSTRRKKKSSRKKSTRKKSTRKKTARRGRRGRAGGSVIEAMRGAVQKQRGKFTVADVKGNMPNTMVEGTKPAVFSTTMKRLEDLGELQVVERGKGRRPTIYKKA